MYSTALLVTEELGCEVKCKARIKKKSPKWKMRLENKVAYMRNEISCLEHLKKGSLRNTKVRERLIKKYHLEAKEIAENVEILKQVSHQQLKKLKGMKLIIASNSDKIASLIQIKGILSKSQGRQ